MQQLLDYRASLFLVVYPKTLVNRHMLPKGGLTSSHPIVDRLPFAELLSTNNLAVVNLPPSPKASCVMNYTTGTDKSDQFNQSELIDRN